MSGYRIWFKAPGFKAFALPVNPQEVAITYPGNSNQYDVEGIGQIIIPRLPNLATVSFESFFPREQIYESMINEDDRYSPEWYVTFFRRMQKTGTPFELTIIRGQDPIKDAQAEYNGASRLIIDDQIYYNTVFDSAIITDITVTDKGGEPGDVYYNMSISEYRDASPQSLAEVSKEEYDSDGNVLSQDVVIMRNRPPQPGEITVDRTVEINGRAYQSPDEDDDDWDKTKTVISHVESRVSRVLPPSVAKTTHSIYVNGLGWLNKKDCSTLDVRSNIYGIRRLVLDNVQ